MALSSKRPLPESAISESVGKGIHAYREKETSSGLLYFRMMLWVQGFLEPTGWFNMQPCNAMDVLRYRWDCGGKYAGWNFYARSMPVIWHTQCSTST